MKVDVLIGDNDYGTAFHFAQAFASGLRKHHVMTRLHWIADGHFFHAFYDMLEDPPDMTCSFSDITVQGRPLAELWKIPHLSILIDPPIYFLHQWSQSEHLISCVDELDFSFVKSQGHKSVLFLPHGADPRHLTSVDNERPYEFVFFGTCVDYEQVAAGWAKKDRAILYAASEKVLSRDGCSIAQALVECNVTAYDFPRFHTEVDRYTRGKDRIELIRHLKGHPIHIWGNGPWGKFFPHSMVHTAVPFADTMEIMKKSKVVLNSMPRFKAGFHERILYALMCGAAVYTGKTAYLQKELNSVFTYCFGEWDSPSFEDWKERGEAGQKAVLAHHTWADRALDLISHMKKSPHFFKEVTKIKRIDRRKSRACIP